MTKQYLFNEGWKHEPSEEDIKEYEKQYKQLIKELFKIINTLIKEVCPNRIEIKNIEFFGNGVFMDLNKKGYYRPPKKQIGIDRAYMDEKNEIVKIIIHELAHAYQHQILKDYYVFNKKNWSNRGLHDDLFYEIKSYFNLCFRTKKGSEKEPVITK